MKDGGDVFGVLGWGLRRYAWVVALCVLALGVLIPRLLDRVPDQYEAQAQVGPTEALNLPNLDPLPRLGESVFNNGGVAEAVRQSVTPRIPRTVSVIPERVELVAAQDNIVFIVVGHGSNPQSAERIANLAAARFTQELNKYAESVGSFAIQRLATAPEEPVARVSGPLALGIGLLSGLTAGVGLVALLLVWRRPIVDASGAQETTGTPVFGRVLLTANRDGTRGLPQLCRLLVAGPTDTLLIAGPRSTRRDRRILADELGNVLGWTRSVVALDPQDGLNRSLAQVGSRKAGPREFVIIDSPSQVEVATRPDTSLVLLVVREGTPHASLRRQTEQYLDGGEAGVVLVHRRRWDPRLWRKSLGGHAHRTVRAKRAKHGWASDDDTGLASPAPE